MSPDPQFPSAADSDPVAMGLVAAGSYRNMWWVTHNEHGAVMARGVHGQALYVR